MTGTSTASMLAQSPRAYASGIVLRQLGEDAMSEFGEMVSSTEVRLRFLGESMAAERPEIFEDHMAWTRVVHASRGGDVRLIERNLEAMSEELAERLPGASGEMAASYVDRGLEAFRTAKPDSVSHLVDGAPLIEEARSYLVAVLEGRVSAALSIVDNLLDDGRDIRDVLSRVIILAQREIGRLWQVGDASVADEHLSSRTTEQVIASMQARVRGRVEPSGKRVLFAAGEGDLHDLGQRIASLHFELSGWEPIVFGASMPASAVVHAVNDYSADVVAISIQIGLHVRATAELVSKVLETGVPIIVGGRMLEVVPDLWKVMGAQGGAVDAAEAVTIANELTSRD